MRDGRPHGGRAERLAVSRSILRGHRVRHREAIRATAAASRVCPVAASQDFAAAAAPDPAAVVIAGHAALSSCVCWSARGAGSRWSILNEARGCPCPSPDARCGILPSLARCCPHFAILAALGQQRRLSGTGSPSLPPVAQVFNLCVFTVHFGLACDSGRGSSRIGGTRRSRCDVCPAAVALKRLSRELTRPAGAEHVAGRLR